MSIISKSHIEEELFAQIKLAGFPIPDRNVRGLVPGRRYECDFYWKTYAVGCETQGSTWVPNRGHSSGAGIQRDICKLNMMQLHGIILIQCTKHDVESGMALNWIEAALKLRGWIKPSAIRQTTSSLVGR